MKAATKKAKPSRPVSRRPTQGRAVSAPAQAIVRARPEPPKVAEAIEKLLIEGNLAPLSAENRLEYYNKLCRSLGLNPLTKPFAYIQLNGKLVLYAVKDCTDQLRKIHGISVTDSRRTIEDGLCIVEVKVCNREGRTDTGTGAVLIQNTTGEARANVIMKAETKAKRRATLSICGLGMLDESELDTMRGSYKTLTPEGRVIEEAEVENPALDRYMEREKDAMAKLTPEQREIVERKMHKPAEAGPSLTPVAAAAETPAASIPSLFWKAFPESGTYEITGNRELMHAHRDLLAPLWNAAAKAVVATAAELGKLISRFEDLKVPFRELK